MERRFVVMSFAIAVVMCASATPASAASDPAVLWHAYPLTGSGGRADRDPASTARPRALPAVWAPAKQVDGWLPGIVSRGSLAVVGLVGLSWVAGRVRRRQRPAPSAASSVATAPHARTGPRAAAGDGVALPWLVDLSAPRRPRPPVGDAQSDPVTPPRHARDRAGTAIYDEAYARETERMSRLRLRIGSDVTRDSTTKERR